MPSLERQSRPSDPTDLVRLFSSDAERATMLRQPEALVSRCEHVLSSLLREMRKIHAERAAERVDHEHIQQASCKPSPPTSLSPPPLLRPAAAVLSPPLPPFISSSSLHILPPSPSFPSHPLPSLPSPLLFLSLSLPSHLLLPPPLPFSPFPAFALPITRSSPHLCFSLHAGEE